MEKSLFQEGHFVKFNRQDGPLREQLQASPILRGSQAFAVAEVTRGALRKPTVGG